MTDRPAIVIVAAALASVTAVLAGVTMGEGAIGEARLAARYTARASFLLFLPVYLAAPLAGLSSKGWTRTLAANRRRLGLGFALAHFVHLGALVAYFRLSGETPRPLTLAGGGLGYVLLAGMVLTSTGGARRAMGRWWTRLHAAGLHWLWFVFALSYLGRIGDPDRAAVGLVFAPVAIAAGAMRLAAWVRMRRPTVASDRA